MYENYENETFNETSYLEEQLETLNALEVEKSAYEGNWIPRELFMEIIDTKKTIGILNGIYL